MRAQQQDRADEGGIFAQWARAISDATLPRWTGPRVAWPAPSERPASQAPAARGFLCPVAVHLEAGVPLARGLEALAALERVHAWMEEHGWGTPYPDGGRGGTDGFDLYLRAGPVEAMPGSADRPEAAPGEREAVPPRAIRIGFDAPIHWAAFDAVSAFAEVDARAPDLEACVISAYAQAIVAELDPAEAPAWRRAIGTFVAYQLTGGFGCAEDALALAQAAPEQGWVSHAPGSGEAGALLLAAISARHDGGSGHFVRDLVHAARQWTWEGAGLRAEPDLWQAIAHFLEVSRDPLPRLAETLAVARYFTGFRAGSDTDAMPFLRDVAYEVPAGARAVWSNMPRTLFFGTPELETLGSAYAWVDVAGAPEGSRLRIWLRGEYGVEWSMVAVRLDAEGREISRMRIPTRREPRGYLPVELDARTAAVLIVVTNLGARRPDADEPDESLRGFKLIVDLAAEGE